MALLWTLNPYDRDAVGYALCQRCHCRIDEPDDGDDWFCESCLEIVERELLSLPVDVRLP